MWQQQGLTDFPVFQFALVRIPGQPEIDINAGPGSLLADLLALEAAEEVAVEKIETDETG